MPYGDLRYKALFLRRLRDLALFCRLARARGFSSKAFDAGAGFPLRVGEAWTISPSLSAQLGDRKYSRVYYGCGFGLRSPRTKRRAERYCRFAAISYRLSRSTSAALFANRKRFADSRRRFANSQIRRRRSR
jgi:hypothetical protein